MPASAQYHVILDGQGYLVDLDSYHRAVSHPFAPKTRVGPTAYTDLSHLSAWAQDNWRGGFGYTERDSAQPTRFADCTGVDPSFGDVRLGRSTTSEFQAPSSVTHLSQFAVYNGELYAISGSSGRVYSSASGSGWNEVQNTNKGSLTSIAVFNGWLIIGSGSDGDLIKFDGTTWTNPWITLASTPLGVHALFAHVYTAGTTALFAGVSLTATTCRLSRVSTGVVETQIHTINFPHIEAIRPNGSRLWYATLDDTNGVRGQLWTTTDGTSVTFVADLPDNAITSFAPFRGQLYAGSRTQGKLWIVTTAGLTEAFTIPEVAQAGSPPAYTAAIRSIVTDRGRLFIPVLDAKGPGIYQFDPDGQGWARIATAAVGTEPWGLAVHNSDLFLATQDSAGGRIYRAPRNSYPTTGELITSWYDADLGSLEKVYTRLTIAHAPLAANQTIAIDYAIDDNGSWTALGTSSTTNATAATFAFAAGVRGRRIRFRFTLTVSTQTATPKLRDAVLEFALGPLGVTGTGVKSEWDFFALLEGSAQTPLVRLDHSAESLTAAQLSAALWTSAGKNQTVTFTDIDAVARTVYVRDLDETPARLSDRIALSRRGHVHLLEA